MSNYTCTNHGPIVIRLQIEISGQRNNGIVHEYIRVYLQTRHTNTDLPTWKYNIMLSEDIRFQFTIIIIITRTRGGDNARDHWSRSIRAKNRRDSHTRACARARRTRTHTQSSSVTRRKLDAGGDTFVLKGRNSGAEGVREGGSHIVLRHLGRRTRDTTYIRVCYHVAAAAAVGRYSRARDGRPTSSRSDGGGARDDVQNGRPHESVVWAPIYTPAAERCEEVAGGRSAHSPPPPRSACGGG